MKREFLEQLGLEKDIIDKVISQNGVDIENAKKEVETLTAERDQYKEQIDAANAEIERFKGLDVEGIQTAAENWKTKYETETASLQEQLKQKDYNRAVEIVVQDIKFSSKAAQKAFLADLSEKKLPLEEDKLLGFDDFLNKYKEEDPGTFESEKQTPPKYAEGTGTDPVLAPVSEMVNSIRVASGLDEK